MDNLILVGFGKHKLSELIKEGDEEKAILAPTKWPPVYRKQSRCSDTEIGDFAYYVNWMKEIIEREECPGNSNE